MGRTVPELESTMNYAELREWENYFRYEPTAADRMEQQMAILMQMVSGFVYKEPLKMDDFMICPKKRPKVKKESSKVKELWAKIVKTFGDKDEQ